MTHAELSDDQRAKLAAYLADIIGRLYALNRAATAGNGAAFVADYGATTVAPILDLLDAGAEIPNPTGYADTSARTKEDVQTLRTVMGGLRVQRQQMVGLLVKCLGLKNAG